MILGESRKKGREKDYLKEVNNHLFVNFETSHKNHNL